MTTFIIGISCYYHDSAAALILNGEIVSAAQEERFSRKKHDSNFPAEAIKFCLQDSKITLSQVSHIAFYDKPFIKFERLLETYLAFAPRGFRSFASAMPLWIKEKLFQKSSLIKHLSETLEGDVKWNEPLLFSEHHLSHAASAFYPSPFKRAAILTLDGVGEWTTTSLAVGNGKDLNVIKEIYFLYSLYQFVQTYEYQINIKMPQRYLNKF